MPLVETGELHRATMDKNVTNATSAGQKKKQRRRAARPRHSRDDQGNTRGDSSAAMEEPPCVWSPFASSSSTPFQDCGLQRKLVHQTPQHLATLVVPQHTSSTSSSSQTLNASFAMAPPLLYQEEYAIQALSSGGKIAFWNLSHKRIVGQQPGESRKKNSTFRRTLHPDFVLDTGANAPLVALALFDEQDAAAAVAATAAISDPSNPIDDIKPQRQQQQQHQYPSILALSTLGEVFCISIENSEQQQHQSSSSSSPNTETKPNSSSNANPSYSLCTAEVLLSWDTGRAGATCLATTPRCSLSHANATEPTTKRLHSQRQVIIGYQSGHLEAWDLCGNAIDNQHQNDIDKDKDSEISAAADARRCGMQAEKLWTGVFDHHFPIHSLLHVPAARLEHNLRGPTAAAMPNGTTTTTNNSHGDDHENGQAQKNELYLALTLHPPTRLSTASYMELINLTAIQKEATRKAKRADKNVSMVSLENHWVLPLPGKEIRDPATVQRGCGGAAAAAAAAARGDLRGRGNKRASTASKALNSPRLGTVHWIQSNSTNRLCSIGSCNGPSFVVALADGTVGLLSATKVEAMHALQSSNGNANDDSNNNNNDSNGSGSSHSRLDWGISKPMDQLLLKYPCIGLGKVELQSTPHAVCALRGGTVYLIPLVDTAESNDRDMSTPPPPLTVIMYPDDIDADTAMQDLQAFAAGMIVSHKDSSNTSPVTNARLPLLLFSWPGGVIDVYSCHLLHSDAQVDRVAVGELLANGSVKSLESLLSCLGAEHGSDSRADLAQALGPCACTSMARREIEALNGNVLTLKDLSSEKLKTFRSILLRFAGRECEGATL